MATPEQKDKRFIGSPVSDELYWAFKAAHAARHETASKALEIAVRLYIDTLSDEESQAANIMIHKEEDNG